MKYCFTIFFCILSFLVFSQNKGKNLDPITKAKLAEVAVLGDLLSDLPKNYTIVSVELGGMNSGKHHSEVFYKNELPTGAKKILKNADVGSKLFISVEIKNATETTKKTYLFRVMG